MGWLAKGRVDDGQLAADDFDVVVIGSGAAGLTAALGASARGAKVLVLEKSSQLGGTASVSRGTVWVPLNVDMAEHGEPDDRDEALRYIDATVGRTPIAEVFVDNASRMIQFVRRETGMDIAAAMDYPDYQSTAPGWRAGGRPMRTGLYESSRLGPVAALLRSDVHSLPFSMSESTAWGGAGNYAWEQLRDRVERGVVARGAALTGPLIEGCLDHGVVMALDAAAEELVTDADGRVVAVRTAGRTFHARRGVVLACGGFEWDHEMVRENVRFPLRTSCTPPHNTGDGHRMGRALGAAFAEMTEAWWSPMVVIPGREIEGRPIGTSLRNERHFPGLILVDARGRRFVNESQDYHSLVRAAYATVAGRLDDLRMHAVFDSRFLGNYGFFSYQDPDALPSNFLRADDLGELAREIGVDETALAETVARFNGFAITGVDEDFGRGDLAYERYGGDATTPYPNPTMAPISEAPYFAVEVVVGSFGTAGGIVVDTRSRVLRPDGSVIEGLYAAGNVCSEPYGRSYPGAGWTLGPAMTMGLIAGEQLAAVRT